MDIDIRLDAKEVTEHLTSLQQKHIPFALAGALNTTAFAARKAVQVQMPKKLDRPTPFTVSGVRVTKALKTNLTAVVFINETQWKYLKYQVQGGRRNARLVSLPVGVKKNKYGNIPGLRKKKAAWLQGKTTSKDQFVGVVKGINGLWQRVGKRKLKLIVAFEKDATYKKRLDFDKIVQGVVNNTFKKNFEQSIIYALGK